MMAYSLIQLDFSLLATTLLHKEMVAIRLALVYLDCLQPFLIILLLQFHVWMSTANKMTCALETVWRPYTCPLFVHSTVNLVLFDIIRGIASETVLGFYVTRWENRKSFLQFLASKWGKVRMYNFLK